MANLWENDFCFRKTWTIGSRITKIVLIEIIQESTINNIYTMNDLINLKAILASVIYSVLGIVILVISYYIIEKLTPENTWKEIIQNKNTAVGIIAGAYILAIAIIIASAIH
jgi:putative membrane protein